ncbi:RING finger protein 225 [Esox lucius]|uniref:RING finger protein 225 n=1 Tax=Esox lucius TaxID=8010 RepID=UPI0005762124|nr:RING finger protein 225 [Esox lucius]
MDPYLEVGLRSPGPDDQDTPDLECSICFSQFNNVFRTPKMLQCQHTFCLECLARMNVKSAKPDSIQCPLCRGLTPLPALGLPKLTTDPAVVSYLPAAMQRVYSIRFNRKKGKLQVKRPTDAAPSLPTVRSVSQSLDVGLPSPPEGDGERGDLEAGRGRRVRALLRVCRRPGCKASLLVSVVVMTVLLTGIIIFLLISRKLA